MKKRRTRKSGFTLMEVLLVMAILVVMASMVTLAFLTIQKNAQSDAAFTQASLLSSECRRFKMNTGQFPQQLQDLITLPNNMTQRKWKGPYLDSDTIPKDPWGNDYEYLPPTAQSVNAERVVILSYGPDGQKGTDDDINSSDKN